MIERGRYGDQSIVCPLLAETKLLRRQFVLAIGAQREKGGLVGGMWAIGPNVV